MSIDIMFAFKANQIKLTEEHSSLAIRSKSFFSLFILFRLLVSLLLRVVFPSHTDWQKSMDEFKTYQCISTPNSSFIWSAISAATSKIFNQRTCANPRDLDGYKETSIIIKAFIFQKLQLYNVLKISAFSGKSYSRGGKVRHRSENELGQLKTHSKC